MNNVARPNFGNRAAGASVAGDGGGPHDGGMEARIAKLEASAEFVQREIAGLRQASDAVNTSLADVRERLVRVEERLAHMPTKLGMWAAVAAVVLPVGAALWWIVQTYLGPILAKAAGG